jgi:hypothetical protein
MPCGCANRVRVPAYARRVSLGCVLLSVGSALLQIVGLGLVARDLWRVQRQTFGTPLWFQRLRGRVLRLLGRQRGRMVEVSGTVAAGSGVSVRATVRRGPGQTLEERVAALEANLTAVDQETAERFSDMEQRLTTAHHRVDEVRGYVDQLRREQDEARHEELRQTMPWQWVGTGLFAAGTLLAMWSDLNC